MRCGVGLHVGPVTFGNIGTEDRLDFTVIGPAVNRAARLESLTKELGVPMLPRPSSMPSAPIPLKSLGKHTLRGVPEPVEVFTLPDELPVVLSGAHAQSRACFDAAARRLCPCECDGTRPVYRCHDGYVATLGRAPARSSDPYAAQYKIDRLIYMELFETGHGCDRSPKSG